VAWYGSGTNALAVYAALVTPEGTIEKEFPVCDKDGISSKNPSLASDGNDFFITWESAPVLTTYEEDLLGSPVSAEGVVLTPEGVPLATGQGSEQEATISFDGDNYLVSWLYIPEETGFYPNPSSIYCRRVSVYGDLMAGTSDAPEIIIDDTTEPKIYLAQTFDGTNHLLVWHTFSDDDDGPRGIFAARITPSGEVLDSFNAVLGSCIANYADYTAYNSDPVFPQVCLGNNRVLAIWINRYNKSLHGLLLN
jgi:hypothetical protein